MVLRSFESYMLKYIELKNGAANSGPAWIAEVRLSKSGRCVYFNNRALKRAKGGGIAGNHIDLESGEEYWVSGVKKDGCDRHWAGSGIVWIEAGAVGEYLRLCGSPGSRQIALRGNPRLTSNRPVSVQRDREREDRQVSAPQNKRLHRTQRGEYP